MKPAPLTISIHALWLSAMLGAGTAVIVMLVFQLTGLHVNSLVFTLALGLCVGAGSVLIQRRSVKPCSRGRRG